MNRFVKTPTCLFPLRALQGWRITPAALWLVPWLVIAAGCRQSDDGSEAPAGPPPPTEQRAWQDEMLKQAVDDLNRLEEFDSFETLEQIVDRLDQWIRAQKPLPGWETDPFIAELHRVLTDTAKMARMLRSELNAVQGADQPDEVPGRLSGLAAGVAALAQRMEAIGNQVGVVAFRQVAESLRTQSGQLEAIAGRGPATVADQLKSFAKQSGLSPRLEAIAQKLEDNARWIDVESLRFFGRSDSYALQEAVCLRDVSRWASGQRRDNDLEPARQLFDWVVRHVQLEPEPMMLAPEVPEPLLRFPWETLLLGRGSARDRAWLFILLARQQGLDAVFLVLLPEEGAEEPLDQPWAVAVAAEDELYLFDPWLGLPIPARDGVRLAEHGLDVRPATLSEVAEEESLLRYLDLDENTPYPVKATQLARVIALLEASPTYRAQRMKLLETRLSGDKKIVLSTNSAAQAKRLESYPHLTGIGRWLLPYQTIFQEVWREPYRLEWRSRAMGPYLGGPQHGGLLLWKGRLFHFKDILTGEPSATFFYQQARIPDHILNRIDEALRPVLRAAKLEASYWLGLTTFRQGEYGESTNYLQRFVLRNFPGSLRTHGARYNLARAYEAAGQYDLAIETYRKDTAAPGYHGNLLRARWLESLTRQEDEKAPDAARPPETGGPEDAESRPESDSGPPETGAPADAESPPEKDLPAEGESPSENDSPQETDAPAETGSPQETEP